MHLSHHIQSLMYAIANIQVVIDFAEYLFQISLLSEYVHVFHVVVTRTHLTLIWDCNIVVAFVERYTKLFYSAVVWNTRISYTLKTLSRTAQIMTTKSLRCWPTFSASVLLYFLSSFFSIRSIALPNPKELKKKDGKLP